MTANTQPIFIGEPLFWVKILTNQVVPEQPAAALPATLGIANENGALIESITVLPVDGGSGTIHFYGKASSADDYSLLLPPFEVTAAEPHVPLLPIITPVKQSSIGDAEKLTGLRLPPNFEIAVAVKAEVASGALHVHAMGGHY